MPSELLQRVSADRLQQLTLELARIRSYTGDTREMAERYAGCFTNAGLEVEIFRDLPNSPCVVARLRGAGRGPTLEFNGHLDTVPVEHMEPFVAGGRIYGRGVADMKGGLAAMAEAAWVLAGSRARLSGDLLFVAHGLHEAPGGRGQDLLDLVRRGVKGDAVVIAEIASDTLPIIGMGQALFEVSISRPGEASHELLTPAGTPHPILAAVEMVNLMQARQAELSRESIPYVGSESFFIGILQGGDFYNRWTTSCRLTGTRRYGPDSSYARVEAELNEMAKRVETETGARVEVTLAPVRDGFRLTESEPLVVTLRQAYQDVTGRELPLSGLRMVGDAAIFMNEGRISAVYHGPGGQGSHGDLESVAVADLVRAAQVYVLTALRYAARPPR